MNEKIRFIEPNEIQVVPPKGMNAKVKQYCDDGSNLMSAWRGDMSVHDGFMGNKFKGYESTGREAFSLKDIYDFMVSLLGHKKFKQNAPIIIKIVGEVEGYENPK